MCVIGLLSCLTTRVNVNIIYNVSRLEFIKLLPYYMKGTHMEIPGIDRIITNVGCSKITIKPTNGTMRLCTDGEIASVGETHFEVLHDAFNFVVPTKNIRVTI